MNATEWADYLIDLLCKYIHAPGMTASRAWEGLLSELEIQGLDLAEWGALRRALTLLVDPSTMVDLFDGDEVDVARIWESELHAAHLLILHGIDEIMHGHTPRPGLKTRGERGFEALLGARFQAMEQGQFDLEAAAMRGAR